MRKRLTTALDVIKLFNANNTPNLQITKVAETATAVRTPILECNNGYTILFLITDIQSVLSSRLTINKLSPNTCNNKTSKQQQQKQINKSETIKNCIIRFIKKIFFTLFIQILSLFSNILHHLKKTIKETKARQFNYIKFNEQQLFWLFKFYFCHLEKLFRKKIYNVKSNFIQKIRLKYSTQNKQQKIYQKQQYRIINMSNNKCRLMAIHLILNLFSLKCALIASDAFSIKNVVWESGKRTANVEVVICPTWHPFQCPNGDCIPIKYLCDGSPDCSDEYDENKSMCTAAVRPPVEETASFLKALLSGHGSDFLVKLFGEKAKNELKDMGGVDHVAVAISQSPTLDVFGIEMKLKQEEIEHLSEVLGAIASGATSELTPDEADDFRFFVEKLQETGFF